MEILELLSLMCEFKAFVLDLICAWVSRRMEPVCTMEVNKTPLSKFKSWPYVVSCVALPFQLSTVDNLLHMESQSHGMNSQGISAFLFKYLKNMNISNCSESEIRYNNSKARIHINEKVGSLRYFMNTDLFLKQLGDEAVSSAIT